MSSNKLESAQSLSNQYTMTAGFNTTSTHNDKRVRIQTPTFSSCLVSISDGSAVFNEEEAQRCPGQGPEDDGSALLQKNSESVYKEVCCLNEDCQRAILQQSYVNGAYSSIGTLAEGELHEQAVSLRVEGIDHLGKGIPMYEKLKPKNCDIIEQLSQGGAIYEDEGIVSTSYNQPSTIAFGGNKEVENNYSSESLQYDISSERYSKAQNFSGSDVSGYDKQVTDGQNYSTFVSSATHISPCDNTASPAILMPIIIKPKDVIHVVGQQLFWKARKAILRQQEVFSNQVFQLHKLIEVQKLLAKMPSTLMGPIPDSEKASDTPTAIKINLKNNEASNRVSQQTQPIRHPTEVSDDRKRLPESNSMGLDLHMKREPLNSHGAPSLTDASFGRASNSLIPDGISAWGYPMGTLKRPFVYPPEASCFPTVSGFYGVYSMGSSQSSQMAPFNLPFYSSKPGQPVPLFYPTNHCSTPVCHYPFFNPVSNDWFAMDHHSRAAFLSSSDKIGPANSIPSIIMKIEPSSQTSHPAGSHVSYRQHMSKSSGQVENKSVRPIPTMCLSKDYILRKPSPKHKSECGPAMKTGGFESGANDDTETCDHPMVTEVQLPSSKRDDKSETMCSSERNVLNLFPLEPISRASNERDGQMDKCYKANSSAVIKAIPLPALAASQSAAGILLSIQRERKL
ncbi:hypothetical protein KP509_14G010200 [Ceratopteris richardii]|nr:hypothetical protein KP509_14G010200 [Ceratopteris richardii]